MTSIQLLKLTRTSLQRGQIHGEALRAQIANILTLWKADIEQETGLPADIYIERFMKENNFLPAIERWSPGLLGEVRGLAEGAAQDFKTMLAFQCMDEDWWFRESASPGEHCSAIGVYGQGVTPLLAQNMDIHTMTDGFQVLLQIQQDEIESQVFSFAGFIGLAGLNNYPLGVCVNTLPQLNTSGDGLPVAFVMRSILEQSTLDEAEKFLRSIHHASGQNYMIGNSNEIRDFECSANEVIQFNGAGSRLWHTNHPLASRDIRFTENGADGESLGTNSRRRLELLQSKLGVGEVGGEMIKDILRKTPVCVMREAGNGFFTSGSLVMTLSSPPVLELTVGPPSQSEFKTHAF